jgi:hypothetical protein
MFHTFWKIRFFKIKLYSQQCLFSELTLFYLFRLCIRDKMMPIGPDLDPKHVLQVFSGGLGMRRGSIFCAPACWMAGQGSIPVLCPILVSAGVNLSPRAGGFPHTTTKGTQEMKQEN